jgi:transposase
MEGKIRIVGIDTAEEQHEWVLLTNAGKEEMHFKCRNRRKSIEDTFAKLHLRMEPGETLVIVMEAPRAHGRLVFEIAVRFGVTVWQVGTVALNHFRECEGQPRKDDHWDAFLAGRMAFLGMKGCRVVSDPRPEERMLSRLTRARARLVRQRTALTHQLRAIMLELAPVVLDSSWDGPRFDSKAMLKILKKWPAFAGLERARRASIEKILSSCRYANAKRERAVEAIRGLPDEAVVPAEERSVMAVEIELIIKQIDMLDTSILELEKQLRGLVNQHPICCKLMEMPGIGLITAAVLVGELLPVTRNATEPSSATYAGVTPLSRKSGKSLNSAHLGRGSNKHVLHVLFLSSVKAMQQSALDHAYYQKKRADYSGHKRPHTAAILALSRQRHKVIFQLMTTNATYDKEKLISSHLERQHMQKSA